MWTTRRISAFLLVGLLSSGCTENNATDPTARYRAQLVTSNGGTWNGGTWNGGTWNGGTWNGGTWNGGTWNGGTWNGGTWNGGTWNGAKIDSITVTVDGDLIKGVIQPGGKTVSGPDFIGSTFQATHINPDGSKMRFTFRIDDVYLDTTAPVHDIWRYRMSFQTDQAPTWQSVCLDGTGQPTDLIPMVGVSWDFNTGTGNYFAATGITIACNDGALEKCVHLGYRPWGTGTACKGSGDGKRCSQVSLRDYHQACTRMIRADYCGNGQTNTIDGTFLDIYDYLLPPIQLKEQDWAIESRWVPGGAMCLNDPRHPDLWAQHGGGCPDKDNDHITKLPRCAPFDVNSGLIVSTFDDPNQINKGQGDGNGNSNN